MAEIKVTTSEIRAKAEELTSRNQELKGKVDDLSTTENTLASSWEGEARDAFHNAYTKDKEQWNTFMQTITKYAEALNTIADEYDKQEAANLQIASNRSY